jgi:hypothetical protein
MSEAHHAVAGQDFSGKAHLQYLAVKEEFQIMAPCKMKTSRAGRTFRAESRFARKVSQYYDISGKAQLFRLHRPRR